MKVISLIANDWQVSGVWSGRTGTPCTIGFCRSMRMET
jgi:hypothetical protein